MHEVDLLAEIKALREDTLGLQRLLYLTLISQQQAPATAFAASLAGTDLPATSGLGAGSGSGKQLYQNKTRRPVGVIILLNTVNDVSGVMLRISLDPNCAIDQAIDTLGNTVVSPAFNNRVSRVMILKPDDRLYGLSVGSGDLVAADKIQVRVTDLTLYLSPELWLPADFAPKPARRG